MRVVDAGLHFARQSLASEAMLALSFRAGKPDFAEAAIKAIGRLLNVDHLSAFDEQADGAVTLRLAASNADRTVSPRLSKAYTDRFHRCDPLRRSQQERTGPPISVHLLRPSDVSDAQYRAVCYDQPGIVERITIRAQRQHSAQGGSHTLNLYRCHANGPFQEPDTRLAISAAAILFPVLDRHTELMSRKPCHGRSALPEIGDRLRALCGALTQREVEVLSRGLIGMTSEGTGLDLGVQATSVATYRKRAYQRLGISSQAELYVRLMTSAPLTEA